jgi:molecular chaperone GrpE
VSAEPAYGDAAERSGEHRPSDDGEVGHAQAAQAARVTTRDGDGTDSERTQDASEVVRDLENQLRRALADVDNLRKRYERELQRERAAEISRVTAAWLPVVDDLERALQYVESDPRSLAQGIAAVREHALATLARLGFPRFEDVGEPFDPSRHEAVGTIDSPAEPGTVVAAVRPGYGEGSGVLRPASVLVAKGAVREHS